MEEIPLCKVHEIIDQAEDFYHGNRCDMFAGKVVCNMFFEPSTRTDYSFRVAQNNLGLRVISFNPQGSSLIKNESFYDTVKTFDSFGTSLLIIRHSEREFYEKFKEKIHTPIINAGDGSGNHPTQSLLDIMTIKQEWNTLKNLTVGIIGDIVHSRVAHTDFKIMRRLGMRVYTSGPGEYMEKDMNFMPFPDILKECDVVMMLRIQYERQSKKCSFTPQKYNEQYGLNLKNISLLKPHAIIMHPAPVNRGVEIADKLVECDRSRIFKQMQNGVFIRMSVIKKILEENL